MALMGDIEEAKKMWKNSSNISRGLIVLSTFLAVSSIASLSENVFKWKSFILDGINFYRDYITSPIHELISNLGLKFELNSVDIIVILLLILSGMTRQKIIEHNKINLLIIIPVCMVIGVIIYSLVFAFIHFMIKNTSSGSILSAEQAALGGVVTTMIFYPLYNRFTSKERVAYYTPIVISIVVVLILAAINIGLNKQV